jgi:N6-L-threonylcarbamoyladenine synthase
MWFEEPILAIETSCDETSAAVVLGREVLSNIVSSQIEMHKKWGGIVPEAAARAHVEAIIPVVDEALSSASLSLEDVRAVAVTNRPGLVGALSVGVTFAKGVALSKALPLLGVHHLEGHLLSPFATLPGNPPTDLPREGEARRAGSPGISESTPREGEARRAGSLGISELTPREGEACRAGSSGISALRGHEQEPPPFPHVCLIVSGGHTELVRVHGLGQYEIIGETRDDAAGEAFDKSARLLGLGYPGGYAIQELARSGKPRYALPKGLSGDTLDFSFSGFKTAVLRLTQNEPNFDRADLAASVQETVTDVLTERAMRASDRVGATALTLVGGVAANLMLREKMAAACERVGLPFFVPPLSLTTDNAGMIGVAASWRLAAGERSDWDLDCLSSAAL